MREINTGGITYIEPVPGASPEWYYGISREQGDLYEAEELFRDGRQVGGNELCLIHYPDGETCRPTVRKNGTYSDSPVFYQGSIYFLNVDFPGKVIRIFRFDAVSHDTSIIKEIPLGSVKNCYNLQLHTAPLCLTRQGDEDVFEIIWPERVSFDLEPHESFFLRDGERLFFSRWHEEGEGTCYRYWEETVIRGLSGDMIETLPGDIQVMPGGELWHLF